MSSWHVPRPPSPAGANGRDPVPSWVRPDRSVPKGAKGSAEEIVSAPALSLQEERSLRNSEANARMGLKLKMIATSGDECTQRIHGRSQDLSAALRLARFSVGASHGEDVNGI